MHKKAPLLLPIALLIVAVTYFLNDDDSSKNKKIKKQNSSQNSLKMESIDPSLISPLIEIGLTDEDTFSQEEVSNFILLLRKEELETIHKHTGINSVTSRIEGYCKQMVGNYDKNYFNDNLFMVCFQEMAKLAFPDQYNEISIYYASLIDYRVWLEKEIRNRDSGNKMDWESALWKKRYEVFGVDASEELYASERFAKSIKSKIDSNASSKKSIEEKIESLNEDIAYIKSSQQNPEGHTGEEFIQHGELFLASQKVQENLWNLSSEKRSAALKKIRLAVGVPESRLDELENWDKNRTSEWEKGKLYSKELAALKERSDTNSEKYQEEAEKLREQIFGTELGKEISEEEKKGINRFTKKPEFFLQ